MSTWQEIYAKNQAEIEELRKRNNAALAKERQQRISLQQSEVIEGNRAITAQRQQQDSRRAALAALGEGKAEEPLTIGRRIGNTATRAKDWLLESEASRDAEQGKQLKYVDDRNGVERGLDALGNYVRGIASIASFGLSDKAKEALVNAQSEEDRDESQRLAAMDEYYRTGAEKIFDVAGQFASVGGPLKVLSWGKNAVVGLAKKGVAKGAAQASKLPSTVQFGLKAGLTGAAGAEGYGAIKGLAGQAPEDGSGITRFGRELGYGTRVGIANLGSSTAGVGQGMQIEDEGGIGELIGNGIESTGTSLQNRMLKGLDVENDFQYDYANDESFSAEDLLHPTFYSRVVLPQFPTTAAMMAQSMLTYYVGKRVALAGGIKILQGLGKTDAVNKVKATQKILGKSPWWAELSAGLGAGYLDRIVESKMEGAQVYDQILAAGGTEDQAVAAYNDHYDRLMNTLVATDTIQNLLMFGAMSEKQRALFKRITGRKISKTEEVLLRSAGIMSTEGGEETFQQMSQEVSVGKTMGTSDDDMWNKWAQFVSGDASAATYESGAIGALMGIAMSGAGLFTTAAQKKAIDNLTEEQLTQLREFTRNLQDQNPDSSEMELNDKVLDYMAENNPDAVKAAAQEIGAQVESAKAEDDLDIVENLLLGAGETNDPQQTLRAVSEYLYQTYDQDPAKIVDLIIGLQKRGNVPQEIGEVFSQYLEQLLTKDGFTGQINEVDDSPFEQISPLFEKPSQIAQHNVFSNQHQKAMTENPEGNGAVNSILQSFLQRSGLEAIGNELNNSLGKLTEINEDQAKIRNIIKSTFGHDVVFFESHPYLQENNIVPSGAYKDGVIYVNVNSTNPIAHIIGHELGHAIETSETFDKTSYNDLYQSMYDAGITNKDLSELVNENGEVDNKKLLTELVNDSLGDALNSDTFWQSLYKNSPKVFQAIYNGLKKLAAQIKGFVGKTDEEFDTRLNFQDADAMVAKAEKVLQRYAQHQQQKIQGKVLVKSRREKIDGIYKEIFSIYDTGTGETVWESKEYGAAGRKEAVAMKEKIESGEYVYNDINKKEEPLQQESPKQEPPKTETPKTDEPKVIRIVTLERNGKTEQLRVIDDSDPAMFTVMNENGNTFQIGRAAVMDENGNPIDVSLGAKTPEDEEETGNVDEQTPPGNTIPEPDEEPPSDDTESKDESVEEYLSDDEKNLNNLFRELGIEVDESNASSPEEDDTQNDIDYLLNYQASRKPINSAFVNWFKDSKVIDGKGKPAVVYHGTMAKEDFDVFTTTTSEEPGSHFGTKKAANSFAATDGSRVLPVYLSIRNPLEAPDVFGTLDGVVKWLKNESGLPRSILLEEAQELLRESQGVYDTKGHQETRKNAMIMIKTYLKKLGYDGIKYHNAYEDKGSVSWIAFDPNQIKSVYNEGTWDSQNLSMMKKAERGSEGNVYYNGYWRKSSLTERKTEGVNSKGLTEAERERHIYTIAEQHKGGGNQYSAESFRYEPEALETDSFVDGVRLCNALGIRVIPYKLADNVEGEFVYDGFADRDGVIYINTNGTTSPDAIIWHEVGHVICKLFPREYGKIKKEILNNLAKTNPDGLKNLKDYYQEEYSGEYLRSQVLEEFVCDMISQAHAKDGAFFDPETLQDFLNGYIDDILDAIKNTLDGIDVTKARAKYHGYIVERKVSKNSAMEAAKAEKQKELNTRIGSFLRKQVDEFLLDYGLDMTDNYEITDEDGNTLYEIFKVTKRDSDGYVTSYKMPQSMKQFEEEVTDKFDEFYSQYAESHEPIKKGNDNKKKVELVSNKEKSESDIDSIKEVLTAMANNFVKSNPDYRIDNGAIVEKKGGKNAKVLRAFLLPGSKHDLKAWQNQLKSFEKFTRNFATEKSAEQQRLIDEQNRIEAEKAEQERQRRLVEAEVVSDEYRDRARKVLQKIAPNKLKALEKAQTVSEIKVLIAEASGVGTKKVEAPVDASFNRDYFDGSKRKAIEALNQKMNDLDQQQLQRVANILQSLSKIVESGRPVPAGFETVIGKLFASYEGRIIPASMNDTAFGRTMKYLGMNVEMGVQHFESPLYTGKEKKAATQEEMKADKTGRYELRYFWRITGNLKTYSQELYRIGFRFEPETRSYVLSSKNIAESPLRNLVDSFGGQDYIREAAELEEARKAGKTDKRRFSLTKLNGPVEGKPYTDKAYETKIKNKVKHLYSEKGIIAAEIEDLPRLLKGTWSALQLHQKDGVTLAIRSMDKHSAFALADGTGSGKTVTILSVAEYYAKKGQSVLVVTQGEGVYKNAFLRDAKILENAGAKVKDTFWKDRLNWLTVGQKKENIGKFAKGKINVTSYGYLSKGKLSILEKLGLQEYPDVVLLDESHNIKNVVMNPEVIARGTEYKADDLRQIRDYNSKIEVIKAKLKIAKKDDDKGQIKRFEHAIDVLESEITKVRNKYSGMAGGPQAIQGYELAMQSKKCLYASATLYDKGEEVLYMNKFGFFTDNKYGNTIYQFMKSTLGYDYIKPKSSARSPYWKTSDANWSNGQVSFLFDELIDGGAAIKREIDLDGVSVDFVKYKVPMKVATLLNKVQDLWEKRMGENASPTAQIRMAQRRVIETQKVPQIFDLAKKEIDEGRKVIIFAENVNDSDFSKTIVGSLIQDMSFLGAVQREARAAGYKTEAEQRRFVEMIVEREVTNQQLNLRGTLTHLDELFAEYFRSEQVKSSNGQLLPHVDMVSRIYGSNDVKAEIEKFQNGDAMVALVTPGKGGVGVSLDDIAGDFPRTIIMGTPTYGGISLTQAIGRAWRLTTESDLRVTFISTETDVDNWSYGIVQRKLKTLGASFGQRDVKLAETATAQQDQLDAMIDMTNMVDKSGYAAEDPNAFQGSRKTDEQKLLLQKLEQAKSRAAESKTVKEYVENMAEATKLEAQDLREKGLENEAQIEEEVQAARENDTESLTNVVQTYSQMADSVRQEAQEHGIVNITMDSILEMREKQAEKLGDTSRVEAIRALRKTLQEKNKHYKEFMENKNKKDELVITPAQVVGQRKGMGFTIIERDNSMLFGALTSEDCVPRSRLEKWLVEDNLINMMRLGQLRFRARKDGDVSKKEYRKFIMDALRWKLMEDFIDDKVSLRFLEELAHGDLLSAEQSVYKLTRMYSGIATRTYRDLLNRTNELCKYLMGDDGKYSAAIEAAVQAKGIMEHVEEIKKFQLNKIGEDMEKTAKKNGKTVSEEEIVAAQQDFLKDFHDYNVTPEIFENEYLSKLSQKERLNVDRALEEYRKIHKDILGELFENGVVSEKSYKTLTEVYPNYIPMYKDISDRGAADIDGGKMIRDLRSGAFTKALYPLDTYRGSNLPVGNLIDNMIQYHSRARQAIELNRVITSFDSIIDAFKGTPNEGLFIKRHNNTNLIADERFETEDGAILSKAQLNQLMETMEQEETEELQVGIGQVLRCKSKKNSAFVVAQREGKSVLYEMHPVLVEAIRTMQKTDPRSKDHMFAKTIGDILRTGATASPEFWVRNVARDTSHGYTVSDSEMQFFEGMVKVAGFQIFGLNAHQYEELWNDYMLQGGGMGNIMNDIVSRQIGFRNEGLGMGNKYGKTNINNHVAFRVIDSATVVPIRALQKAAASAETISRFAEYVAAKQQGVTDEEAAFRAMDQQDYGMAGRKVRLLNEIIPFFNAPIQSKYKIYRATAKDPLGVLFKSVATITIPTLFCLAMRAMDDDDDRERKIAEASEYIKSNFWLVPVPGTDQVVRVAKPFDLSIIFANTLEAFYEWAWQKEPITLKQAAGQYLKNSFTWGITGNNYVPQLVNIVTEWTTGYNIFYGNSVVPIGEQDEENEMQFDANSYHLTIAIARAFSAMGVDYAPLTSPRRIDSMVNTTVASLGTLVLDTVDMIWDTAAFVAGKETYREKMKGERAHSSSGFAQATGRDVTDFPILRSFLIKDDYGKSVNEFYREHEKLKKQYKQYKYYVDIGEPELAKKAMSPEMLYKFAVMEDAFNTYNVMTASNSAYRGIRDSKYLTSEQKNEWMKQISKARNRLARETVLWSKMYDAGVPQMLEGEFDINENQQGLFAESDSYADRYQRIAKLSSELKPKMKEISDAVKDLTESKKNQ